MIEAVLDASVVLKWFVPTDEPGGAEARALREEYRTGALTVVIPSLLFLELLNVAGRRWRWDEASLLDLAASLDDLLFEVAEPPVASVARWVGRGLTAYGAAYVSVAEKREVPLVTDDAAILALAGPVARSLVGPGGR